MTNKKEAPFQIKIPKEKQKQMAKDLEKVENLKSAIHFIKNYKKYIFINKKFKRKAISFSLGTVAGLTSIVMAMSMIKPKTNDTSKEVDINPVETTIESSEETNIGPILSSDSIIQMNTSKETMAPLDLNDFGEEVSSIYEVTPNTLISFPRANNTYDESDYINYYKVRDKYGAYIDKIAAESGVDSRIITAMIAQENPNNKDETSVGTYGPMCVTSIHNNVTYNYYHYNEFGEYVNDKVTINVENMKNKELYENGKYGNITVGDAYCIKYGTILLKDCFYQINKTNDLSLEENVPLAIAGYNHGYPDVINNTKYSSTLFDACYSIRYIHAGDSKNDDDQYIEHVLNKIPDEELDRPIQFIDNNENNISFNLERNNEISTLDSKAITNNKSL